MKDLQRFIKILTHAGCSQAEIATVLLPYWQQGHPEESVDFHELIGAAKEEPDEKQSLSSEVREFVDRTEGTFKSFEIAQQLQLKDRKEKKNLSKILGDMVKEGAIERTGKSNGVFRRVNGNIMHLDYMKADTNTVDLKLPFGIEDYVDFFPKNIIVIAGSQNAGKTAFLLNVAEMNMDMHEIHYFTSEMSEQELKLRLGKFDRPIEDFKSVRWIERSSDFADVIQKDAINIIDFLEIYDDFWKVGSHIKKIFDKLNNGLAIIAMQKNKHKEHGYGGSMGFEKPRLYLTMDSGKCTIVKAKNWANPMQNPNGRSIQWKLHQGCLFKKEGKGWYME